MLARNLDQGHFGRTERASPACSTKWTSRSSTRSCRTWRRPARRDLDGVRARLFAFDDILLLTQKARVTLFDGMSTELVTLALRGAPTGTGRSGAVGDRRAVAAHDRIRARLRARKRSALADIWRARKTIASTAIKLVARGGIRAAPRRRTQRPDADAGAHDHGRGGRQGQKTEEATEKKIRDTVEKGQLPHSKEAAILASFVAILVFTVFFAKDSIDRTRHVPVEFLEKPEAWPMDTEIRRHRALQDRHYRDRPRRSSPAGAAGASPASALRCSRTCRRFVVERIAPQLSRISIPQGLEAGCSACRASPSS